MSMSATPPNNAAANKNFWQGERVRLRAIEPEDAETFYLWNFDSDTARAVDYLWPPSSMAAARTWAQKMATQELKDDLIHCVIEDRQGNVSGIINSHSTNRRTGTFAYGIAVREGYRGRGFASDAIVIMLRYFFEELRYQKATVTVYEDNTASVALHEKLGFHLEGRVRRTVFTRGQFYDEFIYGMTCEEFAERYRK